MADVPRIVEEPTNKENPADKVDPIKKSEQELKKKYPGLQPRAKGVAQRKISTGGTQYFDSGDYAIQASRKDKQKIALNPKPFSNPALSRLQGKPQAIPQMRKAAPSGLATANVSKVEQ